MRWWNAWDSTLNKLQSELKEDIGAWKNRFSKAMKCETLIELQQTFIQERNQIITLNAYLWKILWKKVLCRTRVEEVYLPEMLSLLVDNILASIWKDAFKSDCNWLLSIWRFRLARELVLWETARLESFWYLKVNCCCCWIRADERLKHQAWSKFWPSLLPSACWPTFFSQETRKLVRNIFVTGKSSNLSSRPARTVLKRNTSKISDI